MEYLVSNIEITDITGYKAISYNDLDKYELSDIVPFALLYETGQDYGHWTAVLRFDDIIELFDPLGKEIDSINTNMPAKLLKKIIREGFKPHYNEYIYQKSDPLINTCGRHIIFRLLNKDLTNHEYHQMMKKMLKESGLSSYDELIVELT